MTVLNARTIPGTLSAASLLLICGMAVSAQNLGDAARQEQERKQSEPRRETHVYTNEDLRKPRILVPQDRVRALAARIVAPNPPNPDSQSAATAVAGVATMPLVPPVAVTPLPRDRRYGHGTAPSVALGGAMPVFPPTPVTPMARDRHYVYGAAPGVALGGAMPLASSQSKFLSESPRVDQKAAAPSVPSVANEARPVAVQTDRIIVRRGDSLWKLAEHFLGDGLKWKELADLNPQISNPDYLPVGEQLHMPSPQQRAEPVQTIIVRSGDTLWSVAQTEYGNPMALACIANANRLPSVDHILAGSTLRLPPSCNVARL